MFRPRFALAALCLLAPLAPAAGPPAVLTPGQRQQLAERDKLLARGGQLFEQGKRAEAIVAIRRALDLERAVFGGVRPSQSGWLGALARLLEDGAEWEAARAARAEALTTLRTALGADHWRTRQAAWELAEGEQRSRLRPEQRRALERAEQLSNRAVDLWDKGKPREAIAPCRQGLAVLGEVLGERHMQYAIALNNLALLHRAAGEPRAGLPLVRQALEIRRALLGEDHPDFARSRLSLALLQRDLGEYRAAQALLEQNLRWSRAAHGDGAIPVAESLAHLASLHLALGEARRALSLLEQALAIRKQVEGDKARGVVTLLVDQAACHRAVGAHEAAVRLVRQALGVMQETGGTKHPDYASTLGLFAALHRDTGDFHTARSVYRRALKMSEAAGGKKQVGYAAALARLAVLHEEMGEADEALALLRQVADIIAAVHGTKHPEYAAALEGLARIHRALGSVQTALPFYRQAVEIRAAAQGDRHPNLAISLTAMSLLYKDLGDYRAALPLARRARELVAAAYGEAYPEHATLLHNLALIYERLGEHAAALPLLRQSVQTIRQAKGARHPDHARALANLASLYRVMGRPRDGVPLCEQALAICQEALGETHPRLAGILNNLAGLHAAQGEFRHAARLFQRSVAVRRATRGEQHPGYAHDLYNLAAMHQALGQADEARRLCEQGLRLAHDRLRRSASVLAERQQLALFHAASFHLHLRLSLDDPSPDGAADGYRHALASKGVVFREQQERRLFARLLARQGQPEVRRLAADLQQTNRSLAALELSPAESARSAGHSKQLEKLTRDREELEARLSRLSADYRDRGGQDEVSVEGLRRSLPAGVVLIDYVFYHHHLASPPAGGRRFEPRLTAFVLRRDRPVTRVQLGQAEPVVRAGLAWRNALSEPARAGGDPGQVLRRLIWLPLEKHLDGARTVLVAPDDFLAALPFAALPGGKVGSHLIEEVALAVIPVPQLLPRLLAPDGDAAPASLMVVGDVDYDGAVAAAPPALTRGVPFRPGARWAPLPGTRDEAATIGKMFQKVFPGRRLTQLGRKAAARATVRAALAGHSHVHLATHGFFAADGLPALDPGGGGLTGQDDMAGWHPGLLAGLVLAGANRAGGEGILTALEVAELDLSGCELAVLSACETGLGTRASREGLLGLQRAFQMAGARSVVSSLWKVPDAATTALMRRFYDNLWGKKLSRLEALRQAQLWLLRQGAKHPEVVRGVTNPATGTGGRRPAQGLADAGGRLRPFYWAAFVLTGDWR